MTNTGGPGLGSVQTGYQLLTRLSARPTLENVYPDLFLSGPMKQHVVEISGEPATGKTFLLMEILAKCLLPESAGGKNQGAVLIDTDHRFKFFNLVKIMEEMVKKHGNATDKTVIKDCLKKLIVLNCYKSHQLYMTFHNLKNILLNNQSITLVVLDSISAYYWSDRINNGIYKVARYQNVILNRLQSITRDHNVVIVYTKPDTFVGKKETEKKKYTSKLINNKFLYQIHLKKQNQNFLANITLPDQSVHTKMYKISNLIQWLDQ